MFAKYVKYTPVLIAPAILVYTNPKDDDMHKKFRYEVEKELNKKEVA